MKYVFLILIFFLITIKSYSQKEINNWGIGYNLVNFNQEPASIKYYLYLENLAYQNSSSFISDKEGNFLFWTNGFDFFNRSFLNSTFPLVMKGGWDSNYCCFGPPVRDGCIICPVPTNDSIYIVIASNSLNKKDMTALGYSVVNIKRYNGLGEVVKRYIPLLDSALGAVAAIRHANNKDIWVVSHRMGSLNSPSNEFCSFLINENGINNIPVISYGGFKHYYNTRHPWDPNSSYSYQNFQLNNSIGSMRFSPDGRFLAKIVPADYYKPSSIIEIYDFNRTSGKIKYLFEINNPNFNDTMSNFLGIAFSPNSNFLYVTSFESSDTNFRIRQYNLSSGIDSLINQSAFCITTKKGTYSKLCDFNDIQNAPNGVLYIATGNQSYQGFVQHPNFSKGKCMYIDDSSFTNTLSAVLPNFIQSYVERVISTFGSCRGIPVGFSANVFYQDSLLWNFGDPASDISNCSKIENPFHIYNSPGLYNIKLVVFEDGYPDTIFKELIINPANNITIDTTFCKGDSILIGGKYFTNKGSLIDTFRINSSCDSIVNWKINIINKISFKLGNDTTLCKGNNIKLDPVVSGKYIWSTGDTTRSIIVDKSGKYSVTISSANLCPSSDSITITFRNLPYVNLGRDTTFCELTSSPIKLDGGDAKYHLWTPDGDTTRYKTIHIPQTYYVKVWDEYNCTSYDSIHITDNCPLTFYIPDAFAPGGLNKEFKIYGDNISMVDMKIYNRWGERIFSSVGDINTSWNGTFRQELCPMGVYYYSINVCNEKHYCSLKTGSLTLIR